MGHTLTSNSVKESVKSHRDITCRDIMSMIPYPGFVIADNLQSHLYQAPISIERLQAMARWRTNSYLADMAEVVIVEKLSRIPKRDRRWIVLVRDVLDLNERYVAGDGDDVSLATLIDICHRFTPHRSSDKTKLVKKLAQIDICHTLPMLQYEFCAMWNELVHKTEEDSKIFGLLRTIHHLYIALHPETDAAPTMSSYTGDSDFFPFRVRRPSFPLCDINSHRGPGHYDYVFDTDTESYQILPRLKRTHSEIEDSSQLLATTSPALSVHTSPHPTDASPPGAVAASLQDIPRLPALPIVSFSTPASSPSHVPPISNAGILTLFSSATPSRPTDNSVLPRLRARGLMNAGSICFANAVLQLLVRSPPFWDLFRKLGDLKGQHGATGLETGGGATPLVDATVKFSEEFMFKEREPPLLQQPPQPAAEGKPREEQEAEKEHDSADSFEPMYLYDAMKGKRRLKDLLVRSHGLDASFCY